MQNSGSGNLAHAPRRHYYKGHDGAKNEWKAILDHEVEANNYDIQQRKNFNDWKIKAQRDGTFSINKQN